MSKSADFLWVKYRPFVGKTVTVTAPRYKALSDTDERRSITGEVISLAWRETGVMRGSTYDMVIMPAEGAMRTIALSRIVDCREVSA